MRADALGLFVDPASPRIVRGTWWRDGASARALVVPASTAPHLPCATASVETIAVSSALEWQSATEACALLRECHRVLAPAGRIVVDVPNAAAARAPSFAQRSAWSRDALHHDIRDLGFEVCSCELVDVAPVLASLPRPPTMSAGRMWCVATRS